MKPRGFIPALEGLRGVGAVLVVLYHLQPFIGTEAFRAGYLGVDLFFVLSGFIISHVYADAFRRPSRKLFTRFLIARVFRIFPLHAVVMLALLALTLLLPGGLSTRPGMDGPTLGSLTRSLLLVQHWGIASPHEWNPNPVDWTLSAEWLAYLCFFITTAVVRRFQRPVVLLAAVALAMLGLELLIARAGYRGSDGLNAVGPLGLLRMAVEFFSGCMAHRLLQLRKLPAQAADMIILGSTALLVLACATSPAVWAAPAAIFGLVVGLVGGSARNPLTRLLASRPMQALGALSYSIYLVHWPVVLVYVWAVGRYGGSPELAHQFLLVGALVPCVTYWLVELPARRLGQRWARRYRPEPVETAYPAVPAVAIAATSPPGGD